MDLRRILIVEDDEVDRQHALRTLSETGLAISVDEARNATEALNDEDLFDYDCILLDYRLPEGNSLNLFRHLLQLPCTRRPPVILLTGVGSEDIAVDALKLGAQDYLNKASVNAETMIRAIQGALGQVELEQQRELRTRQLERMSYYDQLTELPNRTLFVERFEQVASLARRAGDRFAVMVMDLDSFKAINDTHGHDAGDEVLRIFAQRLRETSRESDTYARFGGDEFTALLPAVPNREKAQIVAERIAALAAVPIPHDGVELQVGISIGVAFFPTHGSDVDQLLSRADTAMYAAKRGGRTVSYCGGGEAEPGAAPDGVAETPEAGKDPGDLGLTFEPQLGLVSRDLVALDVRPLWCRDVLGEIFGDCRPAPSDRGMARTYTLRGLELALAKRDAWPEEVQAAGITLHCMPRMMDDQGDARRLLEEFLATGCPAGLLTLHLDDGDFLAAPKASAELLKAASEAGVGLSLDAMGAGFSAVRDLVELEIRELRLGRKFTSLAVGDPGRAIVRSIVELGRGISARVVAEGIEDELTLSGLLAAGCAIGQGALFCPPVSSERLLAWCAERPD